MPKEVQRAFLQILYHTFLAIRIEVKRPEVCFAFADHAHNIPGLISNYSVDTFKYYWECERPCFIEKLKKIDFNFGLFNEHWRIIEKHYDTLK